MNFDLEDKLFVLAILFGAAWLFSMFFNVNPIYIDSIKSIVLMIVGAFLATYKGEKKRKR